MNKRGAVRLAPAVLLSGVLILAWMCSSALVSAQEAAVTAVNQRSQTEEGMTEAVSESLSEVPDETMSESVSEAQSETYTAQEQAADLQNKEILSMLCRDYLAAREAQGETWAVAVEDLATGISGSYHGSTSMQSASVIKVFIMGAVYERIVEPAEGMKAIAYTPAYDGELSSLISQMITVSDNDAANRLISILGGGDFAAGAAVVNDFCIRHGYPQTHVGRRFLESAPTDDNYTSADDCCRILSEIYNGTLVSEESSAMMLGYLKAQTRTGKIPAGLPSSMTSANKTGEMPDGYGLGCIENDIAIIFSDTGDYVLCILSNNLGGRNSEAQAVITQMSAAVAQQMSRKE